jgi:tetratricopeptide (TPR) repeat protein
MAATLVLLDRYAEAIDYFKKALKINPADANLHKNLGVALKKQGDLDDAMHHFSKALDINPADEMARRNLEEIERRMREADANRKD